MTAYTTHLIGFALFLIIVAIVLLTRAPEGWEDESGWHRGSQGTRDRDAGRFGREAEGAAVHAHSATATEPRHHVL